MKNYLKYGWLTIGAIALVLMLIEWFGYDSANLRYAILGLNVLMFVLSVPCSLFFVPVALAAHYYLDINAFSGGGIYLNTCFLFLLGFMQWFWIARFWRTTDAPFQRLDLLDAK